MTMRAKRCRGGAASDEGGQITTSGVLIMRARRRPRGVTMSRPAGWRADDE